ncbi:IS1-like element transposase [Spirosoma agri]
MSKLTPTRRETPWSKCRSPQRRTVQMVLNGAGIRNTARVLGVNRNTVSAQFKKNGAARAVEK